MASNERAIINNLNQRARFFGGDDAPQLTIYDVRSLLDFYSRTCLKCGKSPASSIDHVIPLADGGSNTIDNAQVLCVSCNKAKGDQHADYRNGRIMTRGFVADFAKSKNPHERTYKKHNWEELQFEYVTTELSLRDLADKYEMDASLLFKRAAAERWLKNRENFASKLQADVQEQAKAKEVSSRVMILEAARIALEEWKANSEPTKLDDLSKILELAARIEGYELNKSSVTVKDWRDVGREAGADPDELEQYFTTLESGNVQSVEGEQGAGWTD